MLEIFIQSFVLYFVVVDPIGSTPIFFVITKNLNIKDKIKTAVNSTIIALLVLIFFALLGNYILNHLNITFSALKIAGGIILFIVSLEMLFSKRQQRKKENTNFHSDNISVFPLAIPLLAGPAAIISVVVSVNNIGSNFINQIVGMTSLVLVMVITFIAFFIVSKFEKVVNEKVINIFSSVIAIILAGLSVQYILDGIKEFII
ncbi:MAG: MarC family protein [Proteobacteria bacterium]|jgi:multiple antibiotic resistance protein|nr:MarC family protein [Pseudomonadota bacterium]MDA1136258.1 MarC family protein [Pseudomonadota bacterium]|tara:strand:- start:269 stop:877 length:609 start_codon:yes stop_codon:yes gene_type:complete